MNKRSRWKGKRVFGNAVSTVRLASPVVVAMVLSMNLAQANTIIFADNFVSSTLNPAWQVLPGQGSYTVGGGKLRYYDDGPVASTTGWYNSLLP